MGINPVSFKVNLLKFDKRLRQGGFLFSSLLSHSESANKKMTLLHASVMLSANKNQSLLHIHFKNRLKQILVSTTR